MKTLIKYLKEKSGEKVFKELCGEFDVYINLLSFSINVEIADELEQLKSDQDDLFKYYKRWWLVLMITTASQTQVHPLEFSDYYESDDNKKTREYRRVYKWYKKTNKGAEFAFKLIYNRDNPMDLQSSITILKELHDWQNIIKFYGIIYDGREWHFVNEWAEYGNLREFHQNKNDFDLKLKLRISLDIARGLKFVEIYRAENILITLNETAKLANFSSRYESASRSTLDKYRYYAPEVLDRYSYFNYDRRSEVYSFGILLWEIAEERIPHQGINDN
ncbi:unnamed protein product [Rhizophagus irregularis]|uniref:Protein kinase domain-containing protein n=1 Tax=Rhizophagus irregularis TaxID=588596 RepID=A0A915ZSZ4_9GLOM|nr:unnamed protein product [Rhizophagus irregularis]